jgi:hypothetical protein
MYTLIAPFAAYPHAGFFLFSNFDPEDGSDWLSTD